MKNNNLCISCNNNIIHCKGKCIYCYRKEYRIKNRDSILLSLKTYKNNNKDKISISGKIYRNKNLNIIKQKQKIYRKTDQYKIVKAKSDAKRKRELGYIQIMSNPFKGIIETDNHHINNIFVIPVPRKIHATGGFRNVHRLIVNSIMENFGFPIDIFT